MIEKLKALAGPEQSYCADTAKAHAGLNEVHESMEMELCNAIYDTILKEKYTKIVEIGTHYGATAAWILAALEYQKAGELMTIDIQEWDRHAWKEVGLSEARLTSVVWEKGWERKTPLSKKLPSHIDLAVIDAVHAVDETVAFLNLLEPRIKKGGQIALHDSFLYRGAVGKPATEFFHKPAIEPHWLTIDVPIGCGMFVAKRI